MHDRAYKSQQSATCLPCRSMSIKSGQSYKITNQLTELAVDLNNGNNKSVIGWNPHGGENQQWIIDEQVNGQWIIRSVSSQKYLGVEKVPENGTHLVVLDKPQFWDIEILPGRGDPTRLSVRLCQRVRGTCFVADCPQEKPAVGNDLQLWAAWGGKNQTWVLEEFSSWLLHRSLSIKSGQRYKITNQKTKLVLDLSGINNKSIIGYNFHGGANQQWLIEKQVNSQYTIRSLGHQKYLSIEETPDNGAHLVGLDKPQFWDIEILPGSDDPTKLSVKLCQWIRGTCFVPDCPVEKDVATDLQLAKTSGENQVWVLEQYS
ncbi:ricin B lectin domain-containing protein [Lactarius indigo]|nr:ricin B lectin domain-containing protein [Lactarius indigo]